MDVHFDDEVLMHYGVKGMRKGVRKQRLTGGKRVRKRKPKSNWEKFKRGRKIALGVWAAKTAYDFAAADGRVPSRRLVKRAAMNSAKKAAANYAEQRRSRPVHVKSKVRKIA